MLNVSGSHPFDFKAWFSTRQLLDCSPSAHAMQRLSLSEEPLTSADPLTQDIVSRLVTPLMPESSLERLEQHALTHWIRQADSPTSPISPRTLVRALESLFPTLLSVALADPSLRPTIFACRE